MFEKLRVHIRKKQEQRKAIKELHSLTDRDLADIGINRADIERVITNEAR